MCALGAHTCMRTVKDLVRSTSELWSYVMVKDQRITGSFPLEPMTEEYFRLSKDAPLFIELDSGRNDDYSFNVLTEFALDFLPTHSARWKTFKACLSVAEIAHLSIHLPILESIDLASISLFDGEYPQQVRTFRDAPRLAKASLSELPLTMFVHLPKTSTSISFEDMPMIKVISHLKGVTHFLVPAEYAGLTDLHLPNTFCYGYLVYRACKYLSPMHFP
ncbi:hypothetical protein ARMSODRAFT_1080689 [Armillaria solidipes]|uniref:Uncharacterized protein n=1 Tax=Armillaria solidipes TaxID=1076256 RepID=A0A2H3C9P0_9AGAR|nr:hypothetical protein ARMSODRAFT_1080689 [Armillaria solidipes]